MNTVLNLFQLNFKIFSLFQFLQYYWLKVQSERNIYANLNLNCNNCFFMLCSYKNSYFCFVAVKINVKG